MKIKLSFFCCVFFIWAGVMTAQKLSFDVNILNRDINKGFSKDTVKVLAVMVEFQEDKDQATFGNGKFGSIFSQDYGTSIIDPPPYDSAYFAAHLEFAKNYFENASKNKLSVFYRVLPDIITVSKTMRNYSPPNSADDYALLGEFSQEVWTISDSIYNSFDFSAFDLFLIFHAGVGRDVSLPGSFGTEKDLPSIFLSEKSLRNIYGASFEGFEMSGGFKINNTGILPSTESRELDSYSGKFLLELSINGIIVSTIASYLGAPDLFDTETGKSAIGRFGLMDGQAIFAYCGVFPPEPSAWEKIFLGWENPTVYTPSADENVINLKCSRIAGVLDTAILKIPISSSEYYLIENRRRDAFNDGARIKYLREGIISEVTFDADKDGFYNWDIDSLSGIILSVDEYDWAAPGDGILIWHIDSNIIAEKILINQINADKKYRGVKVIEADGIFDIGEEFETVFGDIIIGEGEQEDMWFAGNKSKLYKNRFDYNSIPRAITNLKANSLISLYDFSAQANTMSVKIKYGGFDIKPIFFKTLETIPSYLSSFSENTGDCYVMLGNNELYVYDSNGDLLNDPNVIFPVDSFSNKTLVSFEIEDGSGTLGAFNKELNFYLRSSVSSSLGSVNINKIFTSAPVVYNDGALRLYVGSEFGVIYVFSLPRLIGESPVLIDSINIGLENSIEIIAIAPGGIIYASSGAALVNNNGLFYNAGSEIKSIIATTDKNNSNILILFDENGFIHAVKDENHDVFNSGRNSAALFSIGDIMNDGNNYIVYFDGENLIAKNLKGFNADNFPYKISNDEFIGIPLIADINGDGINEIICFTKKGNALSYNAVEGKLSRGFPIPFGAELSSAPALLNGNLELVLNATGKNKSFFSWKIGDNPGKILWSGESGNIFNHRFAKAPVSINQISEFFPKSRAYNWPNPVYGKETNIRFFVQEDANVKISIFDLAGDFVDELNSFAIGGQDMEIIWNVERIQSGAYFARIEAESFSGKRENVVIKIAVIK